MDRRKLIDEFLHCFPEFRSSYKKHISEYDEFLAHIFFGDFINPKLLVLLEDDQDKSRIEKVFTFLERMAVEGDADVQEILMVTILERIGDEQELLDKSHYYMGKFTRETSDKIESFWGRR